MVHQQFINKGHSPPNSPDLNPLDYCLWDELNKTIKWNLKNTNCGVKANSKRSIVFESCLSWTNQLYRISQDEGNYLR